MLDSPPEAYLRLWPQDALPSAERKLSTKSDPDGEFLSALASILVSEPKGEAYALARSHASHSLALFVAGSAGAVPHNVQKHCHLIVDLMYKISAAVKQFSESTVDPNWCDVPQEISVPVKQLRRSVATHNLSKFQKRVFKETDEDWHSHRTQIEARITDNEKISCCKDLILLINNVRDAAHSGVDEGIIQACRQLNDRMKEDKTKTLVDFLELDSSADNWSIRRYIEKLLKVHLHRSVDRLVMVASSPKLRPIFQQEPQIVFTTSNPRTLQFNLLGMPSSLLKMIGMDGTDEITQEGFPHCDCALLAYFLTHRIGNVLPGIGVSKLSCFASQLYITAFRIAPRVLEDEGLALSLINTQTPSVKNLGTHLTW